MEEVPELSDAQRAAYEKLKTFFGLEHVEFIISQGPEVLHARLDAFMVPSLPDRSGTGPLKGIYANPVHLCT